MSRELKLHVLFAAALLVLARPAETRASITPVGTPLKLAGAGGNLATNAARNDIAFDDKHNVYLVVWANSVGYGHVYGQFVYTDGTIPGPPFQISAGEQLYAKHPRVAYSAGSADDVFLVTYNSDHNLTDKGSNIYGQRVRYTTDGSSPLVGGPFQASVYSDDPSYVQNPGGIAWNPTARQFLITWESFHDAGLGWEPFARVLNVDGTPFNNDKDLAGWPAGQGVPNAAYDPTSNRFMVVFAGDDASGLFVGNWAVLIDGVTGDPISGPIHLVVNSSSQGEPNIVYLPQAHAFLTMWTDIVEHVRSVYGRLVDANGNGRATYKLTRFDDVSPMPMGRASAAYNAVTASVLMVAMDDLYAWSSELDASGSVLQTMQISHAQPNPDAGTFDPRVAAGSNYFAMSYILNYAGIWLEIYQGGPAAGLTVTGISPTSGSTAGGTLVTITGTAFPSNATVTFGGVGATVLAVTSTQIIVTTPAHGIGTVDVTVRNPGDGSTATAATPFTYALPPPLTATPASLAFGVTRDGAQGDIITLTPAQMIRVSSTLGWLAWTATSNQPWVQITNGSGIGDGQFSVAIINPGNVLAGSTSATATITIVPGNAEYGVTTMTVTLKVDLTGGAGTLPPFGQVDTPVQGASGVVGAIGVSGWALDDVGVSAVKIYRNCLAFENQANCQTVGGLPVVYIADAVFVPGARPDVEADFPTNPQAYRAGWGLMVLTNMLPSIPDSLMYGGKGQLTLYVFAKDLEGNLTLLGRSWKDDHTPTTLTLANDTIAKPFGVIDTPEQGQTVGGTLPNFGWAVTPDDGSGIFVPTDGSTMQVYIDGVAIGNVSYNQCRGSVGNPVPDGLYCNDDVANIFGNLTPQAPFTTRTANLTEYRNLDAGRGAIGAFVLDTTRLSNAVHTIAWSVTDSAGRVDGIGSRFFTVLNGMGDAAAVAADSAPVVLGSEASVAAFPVDTRRVWTRDSYDLAKPWRMVAPASDGVRHVSIRELGRVEVYLGAGVETGFVAANGTLRALPPGSQLRNGDFSWAPGPGYIGEYKLIFIRNGRQVPVTVRIAPGTEAPEPNVGRDGSVQAPGGRRPAAGTSPRVSGAEPRNAARKREP